MLCGKLFLAVPSAGFLLALTVSSAHRRGKTFFSHYCIRTVAAAVVVSREVEVSSMCHDVVCNINNLCRHQKLVEQIQLDQSLFSGCTRSLYLGRSKANAVTPKQNKSLFNNFSNASCSHSWNFESNILFTLRDSFFLNLSRRFKK